MAGGKLSPRQKMINMMYLVLMALLALNVSAEILDAFENLKQQLEKSVAEIDGQNKAFAQNMKAEIDEEVKNENKTTNAGLKDTLDNIRNKTLSIISLIDKHKAQMDSIAEYDVETGEYMAKSVTEENYQYWMGEEEANEGRGNGEGYNLRDSINGYYAWIADMYNSQVKSDSSKIEAVTLEDKESGLHGEEGKMKSWERYTFEGPVMANLAVLEAMKLDLFRVEKELFDLLNTRLGVATFKIDKVIPIDAPTSSIVTAGLQFQTRLYVAMSSSQARPRFSASQGKLEDIEDGAMLTIGASGSVIPKGKKEGKQSYRATITVPKATGGTETLPVEGQFTVRKPEIVITSAAVQNLYRACANEINIDVPALENLYNPVITASGAQARQSQQSKIKWMIVPTGKACRLNVKSKTSGQTLDIGYVDYKVIEPPKPTINMQVNGKSVTGSTPVRKGSKIAIRIIADAEFKELMPRDANYYVDGIKVMLQDGLGPPRTVNTISGRDANGPVPVILGPRANQARPGTKVYVEIEGVGRKNFAGQRVPDKRFSPIERTLALILK